MQKLWIIIRREYLFRVKQKYFLISTFGLPLFLGALIILPALFTKLESDKALTVFYPKTIPQTIADGLENSTQLTFHPTDMTAEQAREQLKGENEVYLLFPEDLTKGQLNLTLYTRSALELPAEVRIRRKVEKAIENHRLQLAGIRPEALKESKFELSLSAIKLGADGEEKTSVLLAVAISYVMSLLIYILIISYGSVLMKGVVEEKANRIVEVIISSVRPWQLMFGKILGIGAVGLTQFLLWAALGFIVVLGAGLALGLSGNVPPPQSPGMDPGQQQAMAMKIQDAIQQFDSSILIWFVGFFVGGYLLYGAVLAALASMVDQETDVQQVAIFAWLPLIVPMTMLNMFITNPNGTASVVMSMIPFFSPVVMMARLAATDVPFWQPLLSLVLLFAGVVGTGWLAGRIYRTAILTYGQKISTRRLMGLLLRGQ